MTQLKGIIFDCDGVIVDSKQANRILYNSIFQELGLSTLDQEGLDFVHSHTVTEAIDSMVPLGKREQAWEIFDNFPYQRLLPYISLEPGLVDLLKSLQYYCIQSAINTNRSGSMDPILKRFGLESFFYPVITSLDVTKPKPDPESLNLILSIWGLTNTEVVFVGDSKVDEQAAQGAEVSFWSYKNENLQARYCIQDYQTLQQSLFSCKKK